MNSTYFNHKLLNHCIISCENYNENFMGLIDVLDDVSIDWSMNFTRVDLYYSSIIYWRGGFVLHS